MILSVARGTLGVRSFLGFPSELVYHGSAMWETLYGIMLAFPIVCWLFIPVYYRLHTNSVADVIQTLTMVIVSGAFIVQATVKAGGPAQVLTDNIEGGRLDFFKFTGDPTVRVDTASALIGQLFMSVSIYGCQQTFVQRYCSMSSEARVRRTLLSNVPAVAVLFSLSWVVGMTLYAVYKYCDPLMAGRISAPDEVLPFYVQDQFSFLPGMLGLFLGSLFNGALSFLVSNINSLATVTWEDFVSAAPPFKGISDKKQLTIIKIIAILYAILIMCLSLCVGMVGGVVEGSLLVTSATSGALLGVFLLAAMFPVANGKGAICGMIASHVITTWMAAGRLMYVNDKVEMLPLSVEKCPNETISVYHNALPVEVNQTMLITPLLQTINSTLHTPVDTQSTATFIMNLLDIKTSIRCQFNTRAMQLHVITWLFIRSCVLVRFAIAMRFGSNWVRQMAAATFLVRQTLNLAVTVYTPTVALHAVLGLPHWASAAALTVVAIVFNLLGGLAAAIRADVIQTLTMVIVSGAFIVQATVKAGGPAQVLTDNIEGGRLDFFKFTGDPTVRVDTASALIGQLFMSVSIYGCQQTFVQRYCSMSSEARVRRTLLSNVPAVAVLFSLSWVVGMTLYAVYKYCDPLMAGRISAPDEVLPFYVQDQFSFFPGMLGLFLGSLFNGALSFLVSNINSLATVTWEDFVSAAPPFKGISDKKQLTIIKIIAILYAFLIILNLYLRTFRLQKCPNETISVYHNALPVEVNQTMLITPLLQTINSTLHTPVDTQSTATFISETLMKMYSVSYMWYAVIGTLTCVFIGTVIGMITGTEEDAFDEKLLHPVIAKIARKLPGRDRKFTNDVNEKAKVEKDVSDKTEDTIIEDGKPDVLPVFTTSNSKIFENYERSSSPIRTRL
ncbi:Sodium-coupled monocarboxylate transporter 2 [Papilio machaon]|uniref:Sodium-coupled monocarboxylate transporter 2 n=1 Tax=Papilio machaon TaxID=76193 RepID=A0A0N1PJK9_PAPMA|nr:Sodium-coupled monocarboxylate transporter 2 [Papilio machaon]